MKTKLRKLFPFSYLDPGNLNPNPNKIELQSCLFKGEKCKENLSIINNLYWESEKYQINKEFEISAEKLKIAFYKTNEIKEVTCLKCSELFRSTITDSLNEMKVELEKMTHGFFGNKRYKASYILVDKVLQEIKKPELNNVIQQKNSNKHYIGSYLKKSVG